MNKYNIGFYVPKKDTCATCDRFNAKKTSSFDEEEISNINKEMQEHQIRAQKAREYLHECEAECREKDSKTLCFTFDLEQTLPLPHINTSVAFYKRQLWLYNLGINERKSKKATMCVWTEVEGKRGSNEVISCIDKYLNSIDLSKFNKIITFSDGCGGQNRNKNMISYFMNFVGKHDIESWTHVYLESCHSFLPNDT